MFGHPQEMVSRPNIARRRQFFEKTAWQIEKAFVLAHSRRDQAVFPGSSAVEHSTVNRQVAGSNPARGASFFSIELIIAKRRIIHGPPRFLWQSPDIPCDATTRH